MLETVFLYKTLMVCFCLREGVFSGGFLESGKERKIKRGKTDRKAGGGEKSGK